MNRPYFKAGLDQLEEIFRQHLHDRGVLNEVWSELTYRKTDGAKQLRREIEGVLGGDVPVPPKPRRPPHPDDQIDLIE